MKNITKKLIVLSFVLGFFAFGSNVQAVGAPYFNSATATNITSTSAKLNAVVNPNGSNTNAWFETSTSGALGYQNVGNGSSNVTMTPYTLTGLTPNTSYQFHVEAQNAIGNTVSSWVFFTTSGNNPPPPPPPQLPSVDLYANNTNLSYGGSTTLNWDAYNATACNGSGGSNGWSGYKNPNGGSFNTGALYNTTTYSITCTNGSGSDSDSVTVYVAPEPYNPPPPPVQYPTVNITANPMNVAYNGSSIISWSSTNATTCNATGGSNGWSGPKNTSGTFYTGNLTSDKTYNITCTNNSGSAVDSVTVNVGSQPYNPPPTPSPTVNLTANPMSVAYNGTSMLSWSSTNATTCVASGGSNGWSGPKNTSGTFYTGNLTSTTSYNITCTNSSGSTSDSVSVYVSGQPYNPPPQTNLPSVSLWASPSSVDLNNATTLYWSTNSATTCSGTNGSNGWEGPKGLSGTFYTGSLSQNTTYVITCHNSTGSASDSVTVSVENGGNNNNDKPEVTTKTATNIDERSATLNGELEDLGDDTEADVWFEYSDDRDDLEDGDGEDTSREDMDDEDDFDDKISGLRRDTTYYFRAVARNDSGTDYGSIRSFRTDDNGTNNNTCASNNCAPQAVTTLATNIGSSSARLNGLGIINGNVISTGYFEWGTSSFLGASTPSNTIGISGSNPYSFSLFGLSPNTTYFYRAVVVNQYGTSRGDISTFRTNTGGSVAGSSTTVVRNTTTVVSNEYSGTARPSLVFLDVDRDDEVIRIGEVLDYTIDYRNISKEDLYNVILQVHLPKELRFVDTSRGYFSEENNTVVVNIGDLNVGESGSVIVTAEVTADAELGKVIVVAANLAYTIVRNENQEEVFAYSKNTIDTGTVLGASAIFGNGFWPNSLLGWLLLLLLILLIILAARAGYNNTRPQKVVNNHYEDHRNPPTYTGTQTHL